MLALQLGQASPKEPPRAADAVAVSADGDLDVRTTLDGLPVLRAVDLNPGDSVSGVVTVHNVGTGSGSSPSISATSPTSPVRAADRSRSGCSSWSAT